MIHQIFFLFSFFLRSAEMLCLQHGVHMMEMTAESLGGITCVQIGGSASALLPRLVLSPGQRIDVLVNTDRQRHVELTAVAAYTASVCLFAMSL